MSLLREPLLHFLLLGAGLALLDRLTPDTPPPILVSPSLVTERFEAAEGRAPSAEELQGQLELRAREEALLAEAKELGLDEGDLIIRRRLLQKMRFLLAGQVALPAPDEDSLRAWHAAHLADYRRPVTLSFEHRFFSTERRGDAARADAADPEAPGDSFPLGARFEQRPLPRLERELGAAFLAQVQALPPERWSEPLPSTWGWHRVRLLARAEAWDPPFEAVRGQVEADWREAARAEALAAAEAALVREHAVVIEVTEE
ncbi:MAG: peptidyl-prolyl cis-trans isomerase [Alphaproteobacteria bacterium]|nr:peptidyl-prolyl cis-trans isomerase [Alphaproteobacteria bacterium]